MTTVTLTIDSPTGTQIITETADGPLVLPLLFRAVHAVIATRPGEVATVTQAMQLLRDFLVAAGSSPVAADAPAKTMLRVPDPVKSPLEVDVVQAEPADHST